MSLKKNKSRHNQVQRKLMDEGLRLIACQGLHGCKVEDITNAADVGKGTFFNYFGSKDNFVAKLIEYCLADLARRLSPLAASPPLAEPLLTSLGGVYLRYFQLRPEVAALIIQSISLPQDSEAGQQIKNSLQRHLELVSQILQPIGQELGWGGNLRELALSLLSLSCGFFWMNQGMDSPPGSLLDRLSKVLARGLSRTV